MNTFITLVLLSVASFTTSAYETTFDLGLRTFHYERTYTSPTGEKGLSYNENNRGLGVKLILDNGVEYHVGRYLNSYSTYSSYLSMFKCIKGGKVKLGILLANGYVGAGVDGYVLSPVLAKSFNIYGTTVDIIMTPTLIGIRPSYKF